jgi:hypothetical protein
MKVTKKQARAKLLTATPGDVDKPLGQMWAARIDLHDIIDVDSGCEVHEGCIYTYADTKKEAVAVRDEMIRAFNRSGK